MERRLNSKLSGLLEVIKPTKSTTSEPSTNLSGTRFDKVQITDPYIIEKPVQFNHQTVKEFTLAKKWPKIDKG